VVPRSLRRHAGRLDKDGHEFFQNGLQQAVEVGDCQEWAGRPDQPLPAHVVVPMLERHAQGGEVPVDGLQGRQLARA
jgi:hypothetical protein